MNIDTSNAVRLSQYFLPTLKETPQEAQIVSHRYMLRAGMVRHAEPSRPATCIDAKQFELPAASPLKLEENTVKDAPHCLYQYSFLIQTFLKTVNPSRTIIHGINLGKTPFFVHRPMDKKGRLS